MTERYAESVCLFHVTQGGVLWDFEVDREDTPAYSPPDAPVDAACDGGAEDADVELFALARARFERDLVANAVGVQSCLAAIRGWKT